MASRRWLVESSLSTDRSYLTTIHDLKQGDYAAVPDDREFTSAEALDLADLFLIRLDLEDLANNLSVLNTLSNQPNTTELAVSDALYRDFLSVFVDCISRHSIETVFDSDVELAAIKHFRVLRTSHAAHRYGPTRQATVSVKVSADKMEFGPCSLRLSGPNVSKIAINLTYVQKAQQEVERKMRTLEQTVKDQLIGRLCRT